MAVTVFGTKEWAPHNANCCLGCSHDCKYCYAKSMAVRFKRATPATWREERAYLHKAREMARKKPTRIMFPTTHDITPTVLDTCLAALDLMLTAGHEMLIVSKPHLVCIEEICQRFSDAGSRILFRFTIGSADDDTLRFWEPGAPSYQERLCALEYAYGAGFGTSVSCEPMLDQNIEAVVGAALPFVTDAIWIGKVNQLRQRLKINGFADDAETMRAAEELIAWQCDNSSIEALHRRLKNNAQIKWKESIKEVVGIDIPDEAGLDI